MCTGEKHYAHATCGKSFADAAYLKTELRLHTDGKPYLFAA